ncbi:DUF3892 domain-containing protein [Clostridium intestinale]|uniref:DUF3892 domain-containing protein n=2 Tax=Clostridium intestinale TaxID=36845 RepID=U2Q2C9_9CLOT|nr:DUF3892 domain-containing protein [Clostridium intestinale]ERK30224.1 hypothetical protein CINTURNW_2359 [Clostridium intestinale URNW]
MEKDRITAIKSSSSGEIEAYELSSGRIITKEEAIGLARDGKIDGVQVLESKNGEEYLRSRPDDDESNNLSELPKFK